MISTITCALCHCIWQVTTKGAYRQIQAQIAGEFKGITGRKHCHQIETYDTIAVQTEICVLCQHPPYDVFLPVWHNYCFIFSCVLKKCQVQWDGSGLRERGYNYGQTRYGYR